MQNHFEGMAAKWQSTVVSRNQIKQFTGGLISTGRMANLDCLGEGCPGRFRVGGKICYPINELISWLDKRSQEVVAGGGRMSEKKCPGENHVK